MRIIGEKFCFVGRAPPVHYARSRFRLTGECCPLVDYFPGDNGFDFGNFFFVEVVKLRQVPDKIFRERDFRVLVDLS